MLHRAVLAAMALVYCVVASPDLAFADRSPRAFNSSIEPGQKTAGRAVVSTGKNALAIAGRFIGTNPTKMRRLWCAAFVGLVERKAGRRGTGSNLAKSYASYGRAVPLRAAQPGDIVVLGRKGGGHVGYALAPPSGGKIKIRSGNTGGRRGNRIVADGFYPVSRIIAVRRPT